jgi:alkanesulfonate monooxygenase SsuD/methylene tetrahydromethanopterin reductase-like flavin-dependent oxidoreductase (luciferase family)
VHVRVKDDGTVDPSERTETALAQKIEWIREAAGARFKTIELNILISNVVITEDQQQAAEQFAREKARPGTTVEQVLASPYMLIGSADQIIERLLRLRELFDISYFVVFDDYMDALVPVVAQLAGR